MRKELLALLLATSLSFSTISYVRAYDVAFVNLLEHAEAYEVPMSEVYWTWSEDSLGAFSKDHTLTLGLDKKIFDAKNSSLFYSYCRMIIGSGAAEPQTSYESGFFEGFSPFLMFDAMTAESLYMYDKSSTYNPNDYSNILFKEGINFTESTANWDKAFDTIIEDLPNIKKVHCIETKDCSTATTLSEVTKEIVTTMREGKYILLQAKDKWYFLEGVDLSSEDYDKLEFVVFDSERGPVNKTFKQGDILKYEIWEPDPELVSTVTWYLEHNIDQNDDGVPLYLMLFNENHKTDAETIRAIEFVENKSTKAIVNKLMSDDLDEFCDALIDEGLGINIQIERAYEDVETTEKKYNTASDAYKEAYGIKPFASEHNVGLAIDIKLTTPLPADVMDILKNEKDDLKYATAYYEMFKGEYTYTDKKYKDYNKYAKTFWDWVIPNSYKYGFIYRYPKECDIRTGIKEVTNHFRYIGKEYAKKFYEYTEGYSNGKTYEDFFEEVVEPDFAEERLKVNQIDYMVSRNYYSNNIIRLYTDVFIHPIKYLLRLICSGLQTIHNATANGGIANILNCDFLFHYMITNNIFAIIGYICVILVVISLVYYAFLLLRRMVDFKFFIKRFTFAMIISSLPIVFFPVVSKGMKQLSYVGMREVAYQTLLENMQNFHRLECEEAEKINPAGEYERYIVYTDAEIDTFAFKEGMTEEENLLINFTSLGLNTDVSTTQMTVEELYDTLYGDGFWENDTVGENPDETDIKSFLLPVNGMFVPVHYNYYDDSIFYYFYDWLTYQYVSYYGRSASKDAGKKSIAVSFTIPDGTESLEDYKTDMRELYQGLFERSINGFIDLYSNDRYVYTDNYMNDLLGLNKLFTMTNTYNYESHTNVNDWANSELKFYANCMPAYSDIKDLGKSSTLIADIAKYNSDDYCTLLEMNKVLAKPAAGSEFIDPNDFDKINVLPKLMHSPIWSSYTFNNKSGSYVRTIYTPEYLSKKRAFNKLCPTYASLYKTSGDITEMTAFEKKLNKITEKTYKRVTAAMKQCSNNITDDVILTYIALVATSEFNSEFSGVTFEVEPQGIDTNSFSIDSLYRAIYGLNTSTYRNVFFMYAVTEKYNILVAIIIATSDILLWVLGAIRVLLMVLLSVSLLLAVFNILFTLKGRPGVAFVGAMFQAISLILIQLGYVGLIRIVAYITRSNFTSIIGAFILCFGISILLSFTLACAMAIVQSMVTVGGMKIADTYFEFKQGLQHPIRSENKDTTLVADEYVLDEQIKQQINQSTFSIMRRNAKTMQEEDDDNKDS